MGPKRGDGECAAAVNRVPAADDLRSNMVSGGGAQATELSPREREIYATLGRRCASERLGGPDAAAKIWDVIEKKRGGK